MCHVNRGRSPYTERSIGGARRCPAPARVCRSRGRCTRRRPDGARPGRAPGRRPRRGRWSPARCRPSVASQAKMLKMPVVSEEKKSVRPSGLQAGAPSSARPCPTRASSRPSRSRMRISVSPPGHPGAHRDAQAVGAPARLGELVGRELAQRAQPGLGPRGEPPVEIEQRQARQAARGGHERQRAAVGRRVWVAGAQPAGDADLAPAGEIPGPDVVDASPRRAGRPAWCSTGDGRRGSSRASLPTSSSRRRFSRGAAAREPSASMTQMPG